jgi:hypothetical protein
MKVDINVWIHGAPDPRMDQVLGQLATLGGQVAQVLAALAKEAQLMAQIDDELTDVATKVAAEGGVIDSAAALLNGIQGRIDAAVAAALAAGATQTQLQAVTDLSTGIGNKTDELSAAVLAGTPAAQPAAGA